MNCLFERKIIDQDLFDSNNVRFSRNENEEKIKIFHSDGNTNDEKE